jgi:hypothetical protein
MIEPGTVFQRTQHGRDEIHHKSHGLTQSERRVLIMIDGVRPYVELCGKMSGLAAPRIERAIATLLQRDMVLEVLLPVAGQEAERLNETVVDCFLRQDPLDPGTIISFDPEEEFGEIESLFQQALPEITEAIQRRRPLQRPVANVAPVLPITPTQLFEGAAIVARERDATPKPSAPSAVPSTPAQLAEMNRSHWGYWIIGAGLCLVGGSLFARMLA